MVVSSNHNHSSMFPLPLKEHMVTPSDFLHLVNAPGMRSETKAGLVVGRTWLDEGEHYEPLVQ